jgi:CRP/FNR family transcriptional regulator, dissimilatory nitrate respiration regulator
VQRIPVSIENLHTGPLFARLSDAQVQRVARKACGLRLVEGESLFRQGEAATRFYLLLRGQIKLYRVSPTGNEKVIDVLTPGHTFAEALMFLDHPRYPVGAQALQAAEVISIDAHDFAEMLSGAAETCFLLLGEMSQRLRRLIREIDNLTLHSATCRVAGYLLTQAPSGSEEFELQVPKHVMASCLSVQPETLSRIIKDLSDRGLVQVTASHIRLRDRAGLQEVADVCALPLDTASPTNW